MDRKKISQNIFEFNSDEIEILIRRDETKELRAKIIKNSLDKNFSKQLDFIKSSERTRLINQFRRMGLRSIVLKHFKQFVLADNSLILNKVNYAEALEYIATLNFAGSSADAMQLMNQIPIVELEKNPLSYLYRAFALMSLWRYKEVSSSLNKFLQSYPDTEYLHAIAKLNLAAAYFQTDQKEKSLDTLFELQDSPFATVGSVLSGSVYEILTEVYFSEGNYIKAKKYLHLAKKNIRSGVRVESYHILKWEFLLKITTSNLSGTKSDEGLVKNSLLKLINKFSQANQSEVIRDTIYNYCQIIPDQDLLLKLYVGTPFNSFRKKLETKFDFMFSKQFEELLCIPDLNKPGGFYMTPEKTSLRKTAHVFDVSKFDSQELAFLNTILRDFFGQWSQRRLHQFLFPGVFYNPISSPHKLNQYLYVARKWIDENRFPIEIEVSKGVFKFRFTAPILLTNLTSSAFYLRDENPNLTKSALELLEQLNDGKLIESQLTSNICSQVMGWNLRKSQRAILELKNAGIRQLKNT